MRLKDALELVPEFFPGGFDQVQRHLSVEWVEDALTATGTATIRRRRIPAEHTISLLLGMALMRNESIERIALLLGVALPAKSGVGPARSGLTKARQRLGVAPLEYLFTRSAEVWSSRSADAHTLARSRALRH